MGQARRRSPIARVAVAAGGGFLVLGGIAGLALPVVPGWALILGGLAVLAGEFVWARRLLDGARSRMERVVTRRPSRDRRAA